MTGAVTIDFARLPKPNVIAALAFEALLAARLTDFQTRYPDFDLVLESDPAIKLLEESAYRELVLRAYINDVAAALLLPTAVGADLDHLAANREIERLTGETDTSLRHRTQQAWWRVAAAGPAGAYRETARAVGPDVVDVDVTTPTPGTVAVSVLAVQEVDATEATPDEIQAGQILFPYRVPASGKAIIPARQGSHVLLNVLDALNADSVRPLTDTVEVRPPLLKPFVVDATLHLLPGPDAAVVAAESLAAVQAWLADIRRIGYDATAAALYDALVVPGVQDVDLADWTGDIECGPGELALCTAVTITVAEARRV